jgi:flagellar hook-associated protein 1 FlgK
MFGINSVLNIAKGALMAQQKAMNVTGHNIANVNTPGYTRQKVIFESNAPLSSTRIKIGMGVNIDSVDQCVDQFMNRTIYQKTSTLKEYESKTSVLSQMETIFNETSDQGLVKAMNEFWNAWGDLANNPSGIPERTALLEKAEILSDHFHSMTNELDQIKRNMNSNIKTSISELNVYSKQIAELNDKIVLAEANGSPANDLRDQRSNLVEKISELVGSVYLEDQNGSYTVMTSNGVMLVDGNHYWELSQDGDQIYWDQIKSDISGRLSGGKIGAWLDLRDETIPQYIANLDELAGTFINEVNTLHLNGYTLSGEIGKYFFENFKTAPETPNPSDFSGAAGYIRLSTDVKGTPANIAVGGGSGDPGDNGNALMILAIQDDSTLQVRKWTYENRGEDISSNLQTETLDDYYRSLTGEIGIMTEKFNENQNFTQALMDHLNELRDSVSGVNIDEEMTELIKIQRAYEASAKLVTIADEMLQSLLQMR